MTHVADVVVGLERQDRRAKFIELLTRPLVLVNAQRVNHIDRAKQVRFTPHDLLVADAGRELPGPDLPKIEVDEKVAKAILGKEIALAFVGVV